MAEVESVEMSDSHNISVPGVVDEAADPRNNASSNRDRTVSNASVSSIGKSLRESTAHTVHVLDEQTRRAVKVILATDISWPNFLLAIILTASAHFGGHPSTSRWPITKDNIGLYSFPPQDDEDDTVPFWGLFIFAFLCSVAMVPCELFLNKTGSKHTRRVFAANAVLGLWESLFLALAFTEWGKYWISEPRPDFVSRCVPSGNPTFDADGILVCESTASTSKIEEGLLSFPSGHASSSMCIGIYATCYFVWTAYFRDITTYFRCGDHWRTRELRQFAHFLFMLFCGPFLVGISITASRVHDHRHSPADVLAGAFLGTIFACLVFARVVTEVDYDAEHAVQNDAYHRKLKGDCGATQLNGVEVPEDE